MTDPRLSSRCPCPQAALLAVLAAALVAGATARAPLSTRSLLWGCGLDSYVCVDEFSFCLGGKVMKCADGE